MSSISEISTPRLYLRHLTLADAPALAQAINTADVLNWLPTLPKPYELADAKAFINSVKSLKIKPFAIFDQNQFVGVIRADPDAGLGYWIAKAVWGQGYASEATNAVVNWYFSNMRHGELAALYDTTNVVAGRVLEKLGFVDTTNTEPGLPRPALRETVLTRDDWLMRHGMPIYTERLMIRPLTRDDWQDLNSIAGNDEVARMSSSINVPWSKPQITRWIDEGAFRASLGFRLGVCLQGGRLIGMVGVGGTEQPSLAYFIAPQFWQRGYATEAVRAIMKYCFDRFDLRMLTSDVFSDNTVSIHLLEKMGFEKCGESMGDSKARLEPAPIFLYRITKDRFESATR